MSAGASAGISAGATAKTGHSVPEGAPRFNPLPILLHELNQPLTALQCSLELATVGSRTPAQYLQAIREGLDLAARMRILVAAVREVTDLGQEPAAQPEAIALDFLVRATVDDLRPVAESRQLHIDVDGNSFPHPCLARRNVAPTLFRTIDSALSLAAEHSVLRVHLRTLDKHAGAIISWMAAGTESDRLPFSPPNLGLLVARACWERAGGQWNAELSPANHSVTLLLPWAESNNQPSTASSSCGDRS